jgi:hypothetical protein
MGEKSTEWKKNRNRCREKPDKHPPVGNLNELLGRDICSVPLGGFEGGGRYQSPGKAVPQIVNVKLGLFPRSN